MRKFIRYSILSLLLFTSAISDASNYLDSLRIAVLNMPNDTNKVIELKNISYKYLKYNLDTATSLCERSIKLANKLDYTFGYASALNQMGLVYKYKTEYDSALKFYKNSLEIFEKINAKKESASVLNRLGNVYKRFGQFDLSIECFVNSLNIYRELKDSVWMSSVLNNIGVLYFDLGEYDRALEYQLSCLDIQKKIEVWNRIPITIMNIGNSYFKLNEYNKALISYKEALDIIGKDGNKYDQAQLVHNIAGVYEKNGDYLNAKKYYWKALRLEEQINLRELEIYSLQGIGNSLIKEGNFREGEKFLLKSYNLASEVKDIRKIHRLSRNLYQVYSDKGDYKNSLAYLKKYVEVEDSIFNKDKKIQITQLEQKFEAQKREQQIAFLEKEREIQELELKKKITESKQKAFQRNVLIIGILLALGLILYFYLENKKRKRVNLLLTNQNTKISEQRKEIEQQNLKLKESNSTKDKLFQIIAHDLRSPIVSMESITQLIPYWIEEQDYDSLQRLSKTLEVSVHNVLSLIDNLLNWALSQQGKFPYTPENIKLDENIRETIDVYEPIAKIKKIHLEFRPKKNINVFADRNMLFTVMRNLLNNAVKFTPEYGKIIVGIDSNQQFAKVWVKDSGVGIPEDKKEMVFELANGNTKGTKGETGKGLGLFFCKEFVNINNGDIFIDSSPSEGTKITFTLPIFNIPEN